MRKINFETITGRKLSLEELDKKERELLAAVQKRFEASPQWSAFAAWWVQEFKRSGLPAESVVYRVCQDLEARLGIAQGKVAAPDYRDYLADLIEERYGSRYRFCKETGVDPGHLSRVFSSRSDLSVEALGRVLDSLGATLVIQPTERLIADLSPAHTRQALAAAAR